MSGLHIVPNLVGEMKYAPIKTIIAHPQTKKNFHIGPLLLIDCKSTIIAQIASGMINQNPNVKNKRALKGSFIISQTKKLIKHIGMKLMMIFTSSKLGLIPFITYSIVKYTTFVLGFLTL